MLRADFEVIIMKTTLYIILIACVFCFAGCRETPQEIDTPQTPSLDELVLQNCSIVQAAAEAYAADHDGGFADQPEDLVPYLPGSSLLTNPATGQETDPVFMEPSGIGSTSYRVYRDYDAEWQFNVVGYYIVGRGESQDYVTTNIPDVETHTQREQSVIDNCLTVIAAVEAFAADNGGVYPYNGTTKTPAGQTVGDYLPEGLLLVNPYTGVRTEPQWVGAPANPGQTAYQFVDQDGDGTPDHYLVGGVGSYYSPPIYSQEYPQ
jgi:hypothetical protein